LTFIFSRKAATENSPQLKLRAIFKRASGAF
jgi:hypothetical protein